MPNKRIFYACQAVALARDGGGTLTEAHGVQSAQVNTSFELRPINEYGQLETYENIENIPNVEVTLEKHLDGYAPLLTLATIGAPDATLTGRSAQKCIFYLSVFDDTTSFASGVPVGALWCSGMYWSASSFTFPVDGDATESLTLLGNHKKWFSTASQTPFDGVTGFGPTVDSPRSISGSGGIVQREDLMFIYNDVNFASPDQNGMVVSNKGCVLPADLPGIGPSGMNLKVGGDFNCHLQDISVSCDVGRDEIFEQGRKIPFHRYITFPVTVTCDIGVLLTSTDNISATEDGGENGAAVGSNLRENTIKLVTREGLFLDLGVKNKLSSVNYTGGDTGGGNVIAQYSYQNQNGYTVKHTNDPTTGIRQAHQNWTTGSQGSYT